MQTLEHARGFVERRLQDEGKVICPCCDRWITRRYQQLKAGMVSTMIDIAREVDRGFGSNGFLRVYSHFMDQFSENPADRGEYSKLEYWGLLERSPRRGWWRVTSLGYKFIRGEVRVPSWLLIDPRGEVKARSDYFISIDEAKAVFDREGQRFASKVERWPGAKVRRVRKIIKPADEDE